MLIFGRERRKREGGALRRHGTQARGVGGASAAFGGSPARNRDTIALVKGLRMWCSSALVASALAMAPVAPARASQLGVDGWAGTNTPAGEAAPAAVVGLETDWPEQGAALTQALRKAFAARGLSGGKEVTLAELRLALGCKGTTPKCLARGGSVVGARRLVYGTLHRDASTWALEVTLVEVDGGATTSASLVLTNAELAADRIGHVAEEVADRLAPDTVAATTPGQGPGGLAEPSSAPQSHEPAEPDDDEADEGKGEGKLRFGYERSQSRWKWIGFGVSAGVAAGTGAATLGLSVWLTSKNGGFRAQLIDAANASLTDANPLNDVDPNLPEGVNLCDYAREQTDPTQPDRVRNAAVTKVCNDGDTMRRRQLATGITSAVGLVATAAFTVETMITGRALLGQQDLYADPYVKHRDSAFGWLTNVGLMVYFD